nr:hypothetical protein [Tanacetum cinerariifolium]
MDEPEPHPAYDFFTPGPLPGYAGNPNNNNGWIEADVPLLGELGAKEDIAMLFGDDDFSDDDSEGFEDEKEVGGPSIAAAEEPSFTLPAPGFPVPHSVIEDLSTCMGNLEYEHGELVKKVIQVSDAEVADGITIREIGPKVFAIEGQGQQTATQMDETMVSEMSSHESTLMQCIFGMDRRLSDLERRPPRP